MPTGIDNLREAFAGESQANQEYRAFAAKAEQDGFPNITKLFRTAAERIHTDGHLRTLDAVLQGCDLADTNFNLCPVCGHIEMGRPPDVRAICGAERTRSAQV